MRPERAALQGRVILPIRTRHVIGTACSLLVNRAPFLPRSFLPFHHVLIHNLQRMSIPSHPPLLPSIHTSVSSTALYSQQPLHLPPASPSAPPSPCPLSPNNSPIPIRAPPASTNVSRPSVANLKWSIRTSICFVVNARNSTPRVCFFPFYLTLFNSRPVSNQISELSLIKNHIYELEARHKQVKQGYEEELVRLRRELEAARQGLAVQPGA